MQSCGIRPVDEQDTIEVVDPKTLKITLGTPDASFLFNLRYIFTVPKAQLDGKNLGLTYRKFGARKSVSILIGENLRTVQNMEETSHRPPIIQATRVSSDK